MVLIDLLLLNEITAPEKIFGRSFVLKEVDITLRRIRLDLPFRTPLNVFRVQIWMVLDPLSTIPERQRKGDGLFNELDLRQRHRMLRNGELPIFILKLIGQC